MDRDSAAYPLAVRSLAIHEKELGANNPRTQVVQIALEVLRSKIATENQP
jgi:hypothetical protein